jgi:hypothetical protein
MSKKIRAKVVRIFFLLTVLSSLWIPSCLSVFTDEKATLDGYLKTNVLVIVLSIVLLAETIFLSIENLKDKDIVDAKLLTLVGSIVIVVVCTFTSGLVFVVVGGTIYGYFEINRHLYKKLR